jgi:hypothetical protein
VVVEMAAGMFSTSGVRCSFPERPLEVPPTPPPPPPPTFPPPPPLLRRPLDLDLLDLREGERFLLLSLSPPPLLSKVAAALQLS